jgi:MFS family permease
MTWIMIVVGFDNQAGGSVLSVPEFRKQFGLIFDGQYILSARWQSAIQGGPTAVTVLGLLSGSFLADKFGKKKIITLGLCISVVAIGIEYASKSIAVFFNGKMINGYALGIFLGLCLSYTAEISPLPMRGISTGCMNIAQCIGPFLGAIMVNYVGTWTNAWAYRSLYVAQWGFGIPALLIQPWMPESPWYLLKKGKTKKPENHSDAFAVLKRTPIQGWWLPNSLCMRLSSSLKLAALSNALEEPTCDEH